MIIATKIKKAVEYHIDLVCCIRQHSLPECLDLVHILDQVVDVRSLEVLPHAPKQFVFTNSLCQVADTDTDTHT